MRWLLMGIGVVALASPAVAQTTLRLPLPVEALENTLPFESPAPTAAVLTGFLWPSAGPLTSWAPVYSTLAADGSLKEVQPGGWVGPRPDRWLKVVKKGFVVGGFRVLVRTGPGTPQTRQLQVFWKPWVGGTAVGAVVESSVYGSPAGAQDTVRIVELRLPEGAIPTGLYGQTRSGSVVQVSLMVRQAALPAAQAPAEVEPASRGPSGPTRPSVLAVPTVTGPPALK